MSIDLADYERGAPFTGDYEQTLSALRERLAQVQLSQIVHRKRALIIFEGWMGIGKTTLRNLVGSWDPSHVTTQCIPTSSEQEDDRHWLAQFWNALPAAGDTSVFFRSWYMKMVLARLREQHDKKSFARGTDEINEFESQQHDHGTLIIKLFFHLSLDQQQAEMRANLNDPWRKHLVTRSDHASLSQRDRIQSIVTEMFAQTDTRWAPWRVIDANDRRAGIISALSTIANALEEVMPSQPPAEVDTVVAFPQQKQG